MKSSSVALIIALLLALVGPLLADSSKTTERSVAKLADGVYMIRHEDAPDTFPQGNTTVIIGDRGVFVVDSCYLPSSARKDIEQIRQWTNKPVRYLLNTHWHNDHVQGNGEYLKAFPQMEIVAQVETAKHIAGYVPKYPSRFPKIAAVYQHGIDTKKDRDGNPLTDSDVEELKKALVGKDEVLKELSQNTIVPPNLTFDHEFNVDLGNREVQVKFLGRGNTSGDAIVYLPKEQIVVAGDLLDHPVPYLGGGYPVDEAQTLKKMAMLDARTIVPGHGDVMHDKVYLNDVIDFLDTVTSLVGAEIYNTGNGPRNLDEVRKNVMAKLDLEKWRQKLAGSGQDDRDFFNQFSLSGVITAAYAQQWGR